MLTSLLTGRKLPTAQAVMTPYAGTVSIDHNKRTRYRLDGAHQDVPCLDCHKLTHEVADKTVVFYKPTPTECKIAME